MKPLVPLRIAATFSVFAGLPASALEPVIRYPAISQRSLNTVFWTGSQFVAAGDNGAVHTSPDGITWTSGELPGAPSILCGATGNGYIALAGEKGMLATSTDGIHWTAGGITTEFSQFFTIQSMGFNGSVFRATSVDSGGNWTSADGLLWTKLTTTSANDRLAVKGGEFLAWPFASLTDQPQTLMHDTGSGWTLTTTNLTLSMRHLVWDGFRFIAVGKAGAAATSADGTTWTPRTTGVTAALGQVVWTGSLAVAAGAGGTIITSPNGATWTVKNSGTTSDLNSIASSGDGLVAVGKDGVIVRSTDGTVWTVVRQAAKPAAVNGVGWTGAGALAAGDGVTLTSADGIDWTRTPATTGPGGKSMQLAAGTNTLVVSDTTGLWTAPLNASVWNKTGDPLFQGTAVVFDGHRFVALMQRRHPVFNSLQLFATQSEDGIIWLANTQVPDFGIATDEMGDSFDDLLFTGSSFLAGGLRSTDGVAWPLSASVPVGAYFRNTPAGLLAVSPDGTIRTSSDDGVTWALSVSAPGDFDRLRYIDGVIWTGSNLVATMLGANGFEGTWAGGPGRPWTKIASRGGSSIAWTGTRAIIATGNVLFTLDGIDAILPLTWQQWRQNFFNAEQLNDPAVSGPLADPDHDGSANAVEFMSLSSPVSRSSAPVFTVLPPEGATGARLQWKQDTSRTAFTIQPEVTNDLDVWDGLVAIPVEGPAGGLRTMQVTAPPDQNKVYFRLRVVMTGN